MNEEVGNREQNLSGYITWLVGHEAKAPCMIIGYTVENEKQLVK